MSFVTRPAPTQAPSSASPGRLTQARQVAALLLGMWAGAACAQTATAGATAGATPAANSVVSTALAALGSDAGSAQASATASPNAKATDSTAMADGANGTNGANPANGANSANSSTSDDPVANFLSGRGLLPSTRPVTQLAQEVRSTASDMASELVLSAMNFLGVPYRRGGESTETGFDCSGFTRHVFEHSIGLILPRRAVEQANSPTLIAVQQADLKPGDLVFFNTLRHAFSHVGIYIGDNKFIHSPRPGGEVRVEDIRQAYWAKRFDGARRAPAIAAHNN